ncbi:gpmA [Symbiodinium microadriaticum]|nr:gpmA [Symbiodinium microadriaticum]
MTSPFHEGLGKEDWSKPENLQVLRHLESLYGLTARAVLRAWRLQVAKEMAFNAMLMLPDDQEDLQALEFLDSVSAFSEASPSQRWDRQHVEGVDQPRLELPALSGPLAQPLPPVPRAQRALQPSNSQTEQSSWPRSRLWSPVSGDVDDMEYLESEEWQATDDLAAKLTDKLSKSESQKVGVEKQPGTLIGMGRTNSSWQHTLEKVDSWLKTYDGMPPAVDLEDERHPANDALYETVPKDALPGAESVRMTVERVLPFWHDQIAPCVQAGRTPLVCAHGNSLRALCKELEGLSEEKAMELVVAPGVPLVVECGSRLL